MRQKRLFIFAFLVILFFTSHQIVNACSCRATPTVLDAFENSRLVIIGKVVSLEKTEENKSETLEFSYKGVKSARVMVEKVYKGNVKVGNELVFGQGGGADCLWTYDEGFIDKKFLFYLDAPSKGYPYKDSVKGYAPLMYYPVTCGRSDSIDNASDDFFYLNNMDKLKGRTRLSGQLRAGYEYAPSFANFTFNIIGKDKTYAVKTDKNGFYEIYDLPAGEYFVEINIPTGWKIDEYMLQYSPSYKGFYGEGLTSKNRVPIVIQDKRLASLDLFFDIDNAISGKIFSPIGKPMKDVCLTAVSVEQKDGDYRGQLGCTDAKGEFKISKLPMGDYILVVNDDGKINNREPFGTLFYPGVTDRKNAGAISIAAGKFLTDINIQIPETVDLIEIRGKFLYSDGEPVVGESIFFIPSQSNLYENISATTDYLGQFTLNIPKGADGRLLGEKGFYLDGIKKCPKISEIIAATGENYLKTNEIEFDGKENLKDVKLIFPFPYCEKPKE